jgi:DNA polymerase-1
MIEEQTHVGKVPHARCWECPLQGQPIAKTTGPQDAKVAVISRSPGYHEAKAGRPFSGPSGKLLDHLLKMNGVSRDECITTNVVLCHTDKPTKDAIAACKPRLEAEIERATTLILCGSEAAQAIAGTTVNAGRGHRHTIAGNRIAVVANNPAAAIRDDGIYPNLVRDFKRALNPVETRPFPDVRWTDDEREALDWIDRLGISTQFAVDIESTGLEYDARLVSIGIGRDSKAVVFGRYALDSSRVVQALGRLLSDIHKTYVYHNGKFDVKVLRSNGIPARIDEDTMLLSYTLDERPGNHDLDFLVADRLGWPNYTPKVVREGKKKGHWIGREDELKLKWDMTWDQYKEQLYEYNGRDTGGTYALYSILGTDVQNEELSTRPYDTLLIPASNALADIERYGVSFDTELATRTLHDEVLPELEYLQWEAERIIGKPINLNSPKQVSELLYDDLKLSHSLKRDGMERSVDAAVRTEIVEGRAEFTDETMGQAFAKILDRFKKLDKVRSTYIETLINFAVVDGRIHGTFNLHTTETGRLSGTKPNLQNQPRPTSGVRLPNIRNFYQASPGHVLIQADYSQAELRVAAYLSGDANLQQIYYDGLDLHDEIATWLYTESFTKEQRVTAKTTNFGILYGQEEFALAQQRHIPIEEARSAIQGWWRRFPDVKTWVMENRKRVLREGYLLSATGRKRRFHLITNENKHHMLREAVNFLISSPASDLCLYSLIQLNEVPRLQTLLTVHDSILFEAKPEHIDEALSTIKTTMEGAANELLGWDFPFAVDVSTGERWGEL